MLGGEGFAQRAKTPEAGTGGFRVVVEGGDGHEAAQGDVREIGQAFEECWQIGTGGIETGFGGLVAELDFEQDGQGPGAFGGGLVQALGEAEGVDAVDGVEQLSSFGGFVGLQMADEVHVEVGEAEFAEACVLGFEFLDAVFAEEGHAGGSGFHHGFGGMDFRNRHEADVAWWTAGMGGRGGDAVLNLGESFSEAGHVFMVAGTEGLQGVRMAGSGQGAILFDGGANPQSPCEHQRLTMLGHGLWTARPQTTMRSVVLVHGTLSGMGRETGCEMLAIKETHVDSGETAYSRCSVIQTDPHLPDGDYVVIFKGNTVQVRRQGGLWLADGALLPNAA